MRFRHGAAALALGLSLLAGGAAEAQTLSPTVTSSPATTVGARTIGDHFEGGNDGIIRVANNSAEQIRGCAEFNLSGLSQGGFTFTLRLASKNATFRDMTALVYQGNNAASTSDYHAASLGSLGTISGSTAVGQIVSFDASALVNSLIAGGANSVGLRVQPQTQDINGGFYTFDTLRLTRTDEIPVSTAVPEPSAFALLLPGLLPLSFGILRKRRGSAS